MEIKVEMALVEMDGEGETLTEDCGGGAGRGAEGIVDTKEVRIEQMSEQAFAG